MEEKRTELKIDRINDGTIALSSIHGCRVQLKKRGKSMLKIGNMKLGGTDIKIEVSTKFNWLQKKLWKYLLNINIEDVKEEERWKIA